MSEDVYKKYGLSLKEPACYEDDVRQKVSEIAEEMKKMPGVTEVGSYKFISFKATEEGLREVEKRFGDIVDIEDATYYGPIKES